MKLPEFECAGLSQHAPVNIYLWSSPVRGRSTFADNNRTWLKQQLKLADGNQVFPDSGQSTLITINPSDDNQNL